MSTPTNSREEEPANNEKETLVAPASLDDVSNTVQRFKEFKDKILTQSDFVELDSREGKRRYIKKSGWMLYALACQLSLEKREERPEKLENGAFAYHYTYRAIAPNGRFADADGSASSDERKFTHPIHDVRTLAQTRACNRAISNLLAGGEVSAEEMQSEAIEPKVVGRGKAEGAGVPSDPQKLDQDQQPTSEIEAYLAKIRWLHQRDDGGERLMNQSDLEGYAKSFKDGKETCARLHEAIQSTGNGTLLLKGWSYIEDEETGLYRKIKI